MEEQNYSKREFDRIFGEFGEKLDRIEVQTTKTNGRVRWLEKMVYLAIGFCTCITIIILPFLWSVIQSGKLI